MRVFRGKPPRNAAFAAPRLSLGPGPARPVPALVAAAARHAQPLPVPGARQPGRHASRPPGRSPSEGASRPAAPPHRACAAARHRAWFAGAFGGRRAVRSGWGGGGAGGTWNWAVVQGGRPHGCFIVPFQSAVPVKLSPLARPFSRAGHQRSESQMLWCVCLVPFQAGAWSCPSNVEWWVGRGGTPCLTRDQPHALHFWLTFLENIHNEPQGWGLHRLPEQPVPSYFWYFSSGVLFRPHQFWNKPCWFTAEQKIILVTWSRFAFLASIYLKCFGITTKNEKIYRKQPPENKSHKFD